MGNNDILFPDILRLYSKPGDVVLDMTWGKGVFWKKVDLAALDLSLIKNDQFILGPEVDFNYDFRQTEFDTGVFDIVVLDPPYMTSTGTIMEGLNKCYRNNNSTPLKTMDDVLKFYREGIQEARRILKPYGLLIVKCKDMTGWGIKTWIHTKIMMESEGFRCEDLFILVWGGGAGRLFDPKWKNQKHSRKNNSFFVILKKGRK